ncbi:calcium permease [Magnaporthiopsis poae ATCC 64411]|uniref:Calcium permease n=1 Tax=Magnaporthiopsis poae (strain ATCC 64411 / 73-15) TaxID=644358 RepID=A0A0C4E408_MAGP6|nr:calcium permease [Magnaporthiopsis poae ATCC 64411]
MASPSRSRSRRNSNASDALSPTDPRPPARFDPGPLTRDHGLAESFQSTDTVRRRPEGSYGTMLSPTPAAGPSQQHFTDPYTLDRSQGGSRASQSATRSPMLGPERVKGHPRKPPMNRRASSNAQAPHRGEVFSVDDATDEIEAQRNNSYSLPSGRRRTVNPPPLSRVQSRQDDVEEDPIAEEEQPQKMPNTRPGSSRGAHVEIAEEAEEVEERRPDDVDGPHEGGDGPTDDDQDEDDDGDVSDAESFTLKDRQQAINETHPFGIRLWKPALYKKDRSVQKTAEGDIHSTPGRKVGGWLFIFNIIWTLCFGWWMAAIAFVGAVICFLFAAAPSARQYGRVLWGLAGYLFYPFGKFIRLEQQEAYLEEDLGEGRSISEYEQWQSGDLDSARAPNTPHSSIIVCTYRAVGLKYWKYTVDGTNIFLINLMAVVFFVVFDWLVLEGVFEVHNFLTSPAFLFFGGLLSIIPLAYFIGQAVASISAQSSMGVGAAINAFFSTIVEVFLYCVALNQGKGQLVEGSIVGSIFAGILFLPGLSMCFGAIKRKTQRFNARSAGVTSTMLLFAVIGAFGPTLFYQIYGTHELNCLDCTSFEGPPADGSKAPAARDCRRCFFSQTPALNDRFYLEAVRPYCYIAASMLFLSYVIGLWFTLRTHAAVIWNSEVDEKKHEDHGLAGAAAAAGFHGGSVSTRQHSTAMADSTGTDIRDTNVYKRILGQSLRQVGLTPQESTSSAGIVGRGGNGSIATPHLVPPKGGGGGGVGATNMHIPGFSEAENNQLAHQVAEIAATAAAAAVIPRRSSARNLHGASTRTTPNPTPGPRPVAAFPDPEDPLFMQAGHAAAATAAHQAGAVAAGDAAGGGHGGHDAPNWSRLKSSVILMGATVLYAIIAEILVDSVDFVLEGLALDEKFVGISLFALVPNTTEFLNAISFAMNGNIALSMEIGSAYALQVCLLQIPALVLYSALYAPTSGVDDAARYTFSLLFPQWDMVTVILCVFLLSYMYGEGKSNYFKGSILLLSYLVVIVGFFLSGYTASGMDGAAGVSSRFDTMGADGSYVRYGGDSFKTVGRGKSGPAF